MKKALKNCFGGEASIGNQNGPRLWLWATGCSSNEWLAAMSEGVNLGTPKPPEREEKRRGRCGNKERLIPPFRPQNQRLRPLRNLENIATNSL